MKKHPARLPGVVLLSWVLSLRSIGTPLTAQAGAVLGPGDRVRVTYRCASDKPSGGTRPVECLRDVGTVENPGDPLVLVVGSDRTVIPSELLALTERSVARKRHTILGAGIGLLSGAVLGGVLGAADCGGDDNWLPAGECAAVGAAALGGLGLVAGGVIGWAIRSDKWVSVTVTSARSAPVGGRAVVVGLQIPAALWRAPMRTHLNRD